MTPEVTSPRSPLPVDALFQRLGASLQHGDVPLQLVDTPFQKLALRQLISQQEV